VPVEGTDETFKNGFTIHAEKCPNRRGVEKVAASFMDGEVIAWSDFLSRVSSQGVGGVWISGGYRMPWNDAATVASLAGVKTLVVQDFFTSPLFEQARVQLPGATFPEREGSYVNFQDRLQSFRWAIRPPVGVKTEGQLLWQLAGRTGLYNSQKVLEDVCREIGYFSAAAGGVSEFGVDLKVNLLAEQTVAAATS
jgi:NADH-quinone oxidoreductase subunit G